MARRAALRCFGGGRRPPPRAEHGRVAELPDSLDSSRHRNLEGRGGAAWGRRAAIAVACQMRVFNVRGWESEVADLFEHSLMTALYSLDIAKMLQIPIFHVNGDDPEAVQQAAALAMDFRRRYRRDAVIDMVCYRRYGHNESDDPSFTQPKMYRAIRQHPPVAERYLKQLIEQRLITREQADRLAKEFRDLLEQELALARTGDAIDESQSYGGIWSGYGGGLEPKGQEITSAVAQERLSQLLDWQTRFPANFHPHPKIARFAVLRRRPRWTRARSWAVTAGAQVAARRAGTPVDHPVGVAAVRPGAVGVQVPVGRRW